MASHFPLITQSILNSLKQAKIDEEENKSGIIIEFLKIFKGKTDHNDLLALVKEINENEEYKAIAFNNFLMNSENQISRKKNECNLTLHI